MIMNKKILITGGAGFIGSALVNRILEHNSITIYDNLVRNTLPTTNLLDKENVSFVQGDVLDSESLAQAARGVDILIHAAAIAGIDNTLKNPVHTLKVNLLGTLNALEAAYRSGSVSRFMEFSTSEIYGSMAYNVGEKDEAVIGSVGEARWVYAVGKLSAEHFAHAYHNQYSLPTIGIRPFNIYGPGQTGEGAISIMIRRALRNEDLVVFGGGSQIRSWCYINDMVDALEKALLNDRAIGQTFNIGNSSATVSIGHLAEMICDLLNSKSRIVSKPPLSADIHMRVPNTEKAEDLLGFKAKVGLKEGILKTAAWIESNEKQLPKIPEMFN